MRDRPQDPFIAPVRFDAGDFIIRRYESNDAGALRSAVVNSYQHLRPWMPWANPDQTLEASAVLCRRFNANYLAGIDFTLGVWKLDRLVGGTGFHLRIGTLESKGAEIGMWIAASEAHQGFGTRVLDAMLKWGFTEWPWERLVWKCDTRNIASRRVAEKCGMRCEGTHLKDALDAEGTRRDTHYFAILQDEWAAQRLSR